MKRLHPLRACLLLAALVLIPHCLVAQLTWTPANVGLEGAPIHSLHPTRGGAMLASTSRGLLRFDPATDRWTRIIDHFGSAWHVEFDRDGTLYATTHFVEFSRFLRSTDDGRTWTAMLDSGDVWSIGGDGLDVVLYGARGRSTDGGATWTATDTTWFDRIVSAGVGRLAAVSFGGSLNTSSDGGRTWISGGVPPSTNPYATGIAALGDRVLVVAGDTLFLTTDRGATWTRPLEFPVRSITRHGDGSLFVSSQGRDRRRATDGIHRSDDSGRTWRQIARGYFHELATTVDGALVAETNPGMSMSTDGGDTWRAINTGLEERPAEVWAESDRTLYALASRSDLPPVSGPAVRQLYRSTDDAATWQLMIDSVHQVWTFFGGRGILTTRYTALAGDPVKTRDSVVVSVDHGATWRTIAPGTALAAASTGESIAALSIRDFQNTSRPNLFVTTDNGASWTARTTPTRHDQMAITESGMIVVETREGRRTLGASTDQGTTWRTLLERNWVSAVIAPGGESIVAVSYDASDTTFLIEGSRDGGATFTRTKTRDQYVAVIEQIDGMTMIAMASTTGAGTNLWRSSDSGATWTSLPIGYLPNVRPVVAPSGELFATRMEGIIRSTDYGSSWQVIDTSRWLATPTSNGRVIVAAHPYGGVYRTTQLSGIDADSTSKEPPPFPADRLKLTVRPNPATRHVVVDAPTSGTLSLYDTRGFIVREQEIESPKRSIELDLTGLGAGVYFVRLMGETGMFTTPVVIYGD